MSRERLAASLMVDGKERLMPFKTCAQQFQKEHTYVASGKKKLPVFPNEPALSNRFVPEKQSASMARMYRLLVSRVAGACWAKGKPALLHEAKCVLCFRITGAPKDGGIDDPEDFTNDEEVLFGYAVAGNMASSVSVTE